MFLFQSLIETEIIEERIDENSEKIPIELDLTNDDDSKFNRMDKLENM